MKYVQDEQPQTTSVQMVFHSTPLISERDNQPNSQGMNSIPLTSRMEPHITGNRQNIPQSVVGKSGATCAIGENGVTCEVGESGATHAEPLVNMKVGNSQTMIDRTCLFQPMFVYGGGSSTQHPISIMNVVPQDTMLNSMSEACIQGTFNEINACPPQPMY